MSDSPVAPLMSSVLTVFVRDAGGNPIEGVTVTLAETGGGGIVMQPATTTDATGLATGSFSSAVTGSFAVTATADGVLLSQTASIVVQL